MKMPRVRFAIRHMILLVAAIAFLIAGDKMLRKIDDYRDRARESEQLAAFWEGCRDGHPALQESLSQQYSRLSEQFEKDVQLARETDAGSSNQAFDQEFANLKKEIEACKNSWVSFWKAQDEKERIRMEWHARMKLRYQRSMWRPWKGLEPSPRPPDVILFSHPPCPGGNLEFRTLLNQALHEAREQNALAGAAYGQARIFAHQVENLRNPMLKALCVKRMESLLRQGDSFAIDYARLEDGIRSACLQLSAYLSEFPEVHP